MQRVMIIGCSGAGKSWLGKRLSHALGLPLVSLDAAFWQPGWVQPEPSQWLGRVDSMSAQPCWVMDGNYAGTFEIRAARANAVIFLDLPRWRCMTSLLLRTVSQLGRVREDMAPGCTERLNTEFLLYAWRCRTAIRQNTLNAIAALRKDQIGIVLSNRAEINTFAQGLPGSILNMEF